jgi:hypothetical protein
MLDIPRRLDVDLPEPIFNDQKVQINHLTLRVPTLGDRRKASGRLRNGESAESFSQFQIDLIAACGGVSVPTIEQLPADIAQDCWEWISSFLVPAPKDGSP